MQERLPEILAFAEEARGVFDAAVLLGMGGSSLAPEVFRRVSGAESFHVLDTTHPAAVRRLAESLDTERTLFLVSSKSGTTLETRSHLDFFWELTRGRGESFVAVTDPGSELEALAGERGFRAVFQGEPTIGGRYSALSPFGIVPAALMGADVEELLAGAVAMAGALPNGREPRRRARPRPRSRVAGRPRQGRLRQPARLRPLAGAAARRVHGQAGQGPRPGAGERPGRTRPPGGGRQPGARPRRRVLPVGGRRRRGGRCPRHQPVRPAQRPRGEGPHPGCPFRPRTGSDP